MADPVQRLAAALVLGGIVQKRGDRLVLGRAGLDHDRGDPEEMSEVWNAGSLAHLPGVKLEREIQRSREALAQRWIGRTLDSRDAISRRSSRVKVLVVRPRLPPPRAG